MSPVALGGIAAAAGGTLLVLVGWGLGHRSARREWASHRGDTTTLETDLEAVQRDLDHLAAEAATFPERLQDAYDAGQAAMLEQLTGLHAAEPWQPVPPPKWVKLQEARENREAN